jgi:hypothetical protein
MKPIVLSLLILASSLLAAKADQPLGTTDLDRQFPPFAPDGQTPLHLVADGTAHDALVGGSRYIGWMENLGQGFLFDRITRQSWYIYLQFEGDPPVEPGDPVNGRNSWYARTLPDPMPDWVDVLSPKDG